jgi:cytochrome c-type biogenesis protein CcmH/NrfG
VTKIIDAGKALRQAEYLLENQPRSEGIALLVNLLRQHPSDQKAWYLLGQTLDDPAKKFMPSNK